MGERGALPDWRQRGPRDSHTRRAGPGDRRDATVADGVRARGSAGRRVTVDRADLNLKRSVLATPGSNPRMIARALASDADVVMIDLQDAVAPDEKARARSSVTEALREGDWRSRPRTFRMNALDTPWFVHDLVEVIEGAHGRVDLIVVPARWAAPKTSIPWPLFWRRSKPLLGRNMLSAWKRRSRTRPGWPSGRQSHGQSPSRSSASSAPATTPRRCACHWPPWACPS